MLTKVEVTKLLAALTKEERAELCAALLGEANWSPDNNLPFPLFLAVCGGVPCGGVDLALIRRTNSVPEVLLTLRSAKDPFFANMWHLTGAMIVQGATALSTITKRVLPEIGIRLHSVPEFLEVRDILKGPRGPDTSPRGQEIYRLYQHVLNRYDDDVVETEGRKFFPLDQIPMPFIDHQWPSIDKLRFIHGV